VLYYAEMEGSTHANVHLNCSPEDEHCRIARLGYGDNLDHAHDGADGREEAEQEDGHQGNLASDVDLERVEEGNGKHEDYAVEDDGDGG
jgi:hypothetical protein